MKRMNAFGVKGLIVVVMIAATWSIPAAVAQNKTAGGGKSSSAALTMYADAANYQNKNAFELAAEEWSRFLERFGGDPLAPKAQHYLGVCQLQLKQYAKAATSFHAVLTKYPKFEMREDSYLNLGWCQYSLATGGKKDQYALAADTFEKLTTAFPQGKFADQALFFRAESLYALDRKKDAAMVYGKLVKDHSESKLKCDALYALGVTLEEMSASEQAGRAYDMFLEQCATSELVTEVQMRKAETILQRGDPKSAEALFAKAAAVKGFDSADHALFRQAYCASRQDKMAEAGALYAALTEKYPESPNAAESLLSAGRCYYRAKEFDEAAKWLNRAIVAKDPSSVEAGHWLCRIHLSNQDAGKALSVAEKLLPRAADSPFAVNLRLDKADALYATESRKEEALGEYLAIYKAHPQHDVAAMALYDAAFAALDLKKIDQASSLSADFLKTFADHSLVPDVRYIIAECHIQKKEHTQAESIYRRLVEQSQDHPEIDLWRVRLGLVVYFQKKYQEAIDTLAPVVEQLQAPDSKAEANYLVGVCQYQLGQFDKAAESLRASMLASAKWRQADETLLYLARTQRKIDRVDEALATLRTLQENFPKTRLQDQVLYHQGEFEYAVDKYPAAIEAYDKVIRDFADSSYVPFALYGKGWALLKSGEFDQATTSFSTLINRHASHEMVDEALFARGMCYRQLQKYDESIADINRYLASDADAPERADALYERGLAEVAAEDFKKAAETFSALLKEKPEYANAENVLYELGWAYRAQSDNAAASEAFAQLVTRYPDSALAAEASFHIGEDHYAKKQYTEAVKAYRRAAEAAGGTLAGKAFYKLGWSHYQLKQFGDAYKQFESQLKAQPGGELASDAWFMKGECMFQLKDYEQALPAFVKAIDLEASSSEIDVLRHLHAGQSAGQLKKWQECIELLDPIVEKFPDTKYLAETYFERGQANHKLKQPDAAMVDFRKSAELNRGEVGARAQFMVGELEFQKKQYDQAIKDFQRVMFRAGTEKSSPEIKNWQAKAGYEAGRCSEVQIEGATSAAIRAKRIADAKKFYQYVIDTHPKSELVAQAKKRLAALAKLLP